jgi:sepiapterin reductase
MLPSRTLLIVTGASRGFGRSTALAFVTAYLDRIKESPPTSTSSLDAVLVSRSKLSLDQTEGEMKLLWETAFPSSSSSPSLNVRTVVTDLSDLETLESASTEIFPPIDLHSPSYDESLFINNAGSIGTLGLTDGTSTIPEDNAGERLKSLRREIDFNVTSCQYLTGEYVRWVGSNFSLTSSPSHSSTDSQMLMRDGRHTVVNVSSLAAVQPFPTWGAYCSGKVSCCLFVAYFRFIAVRSLAYSLSFFLLFLVNRPPATCGIQQSQPRHSSPPQPAPTEFES